MEVREPACRARRNRAHREVNAVPQAGEQAIWTQGNILDRPVVGHHGHHDAAGLGRLGRAARETRSLLQQGPGLVGGAVVDAQAEASLTQVGRHGQAHAAQANEADGFFHRSTLLSIAARRSYGGPGVSCHS